MGKSKECVVDIKLTEIDHTKEIKLAEDIISFVEACSLEYNTFEGAQKINCAIMSDIDHKTVLIMLLLKVLNK